MHIPVPDSSIVSVLIVSVKFTFTPCSFYSIMSPTIFNSVSTLKKDKEQLQRRLVDLKNSAADQINKIRV